MIIINNFKELNFQLNEWRKAGQNIGFVPTMGALHEGHASLIKQSKIQAKKTVCSIFVNPLQFNNREDFEKYPITLDLDIHLLQKLECDLLFLPLEKEIYPNEKSKQKYYELGDVETILEGKFRPGHFQGVCLVVDRLLSLIEPDLLFLGQKDYQQCLVIEKLIELMGVRISLIKCPTLREESGLAKSSRNLRLSKEDLIKASQLYKNLRFAETKLSNSPVYEVIEKVTENLENIGFIVEYFVLAKAGNLETAETFDPAKSYVLLVAAYLNGVRLIDNIEINNSSL